MARQISQKIIKSLFYYDSGYLVRRKTTSPRAKKGDIAGRASPSQDYGLIHLYGKQYPTHKLVYMYFHGYMPRFVDHIDRDKNNNKIENLREATKSQNGMNKISVSSTSGYKNVHFHRQTGKWRVRVTANKKTISIGLFDDLELAGLVAEEARNKYHGQYACHEVKHGS